MSISIFVWLVTAKVYMGEITVDTLSDLWVSFAGNTAAIVSGGILSVGLSLWRPANFDWDKTKLMEGVKEDGRAPLPPAFVSSPSLNSDEKGDEKSDEKDRATAEAVEVSTLPQDAAAIDGLDIPALTRTFKKYTILFAVLATIITFVRVSSPLTMVSHLTVLSGRLFPHRLGARRIFSRPGSSRPLSPSCL